MHPALSICISPSLQSDTFPTLAANMVFYPPPWVPKLPEIPDTVPICEFMLDEKHGRRPYSDSWDAYTCGLSGKSITAVQQKENVDRLARSLAKEFGWKVNEGTEYDKVVGVFALNTVRSSHRSRTI
jgi:ribosome assembly protein SQT1